MKKVPATTIEVVDPMAIYSIRNMLPVGSVGDDNDEDAGELLFPVLDSEIRLIVARFIGPGRIKTGLSSLGIAVDGDSRLGLGA
jgi:hypothetical protein